jgi:hypothetical protein
VCFWKIQYDMFKDVAGSLPLLDVIVSMNIMKSFLNSFFSHIIIYPEIAFSVVTTNMTASGVTSYN